MISVRLRRALRPALRVAAATSVLLAALAGAAPLGANAATTGHWKLEVRPAPTNLPLTGRGMILVTASNLGDTELDGKVTITDTLPEGVEATEAAKPESKGTPKSAENKTGAECTPKVPPVKPSGPETIVCTFTADLAEYEQLEVEIPVQTNGLHESEPVDSAKVTGDGLEAELSRPLKVNGKPTEFGLESYELTPENENFEVDDKAGSHPFQLTTTFNLNQVFEHGARSGLEPAAPALQQNVSFELPPGLVGDANVVGNPDAVQQCSDVSFGANDAKNVDGCPADTVVGVVAATFQEPKAYLRDTFLAPLFNLKPNPGEPARFGFDVVHVPIILQTAVRTGGDYGVTVSVHPTSEAIQLLGSRVTFWGIPGDPRHDSARGWACLGKGAYLALSEPPQPCEPLGVSQPTPFLTLPTSCGLLQAPVSGEAWNATELENKGVAWALGQRGESLTNSNPTELKGCAGLPFSPSIEVRPDEHSASTPTGMTVKVNLPQATTLESSYEGKAEADVKSTRLELPPGLQVSPGGAGGLATCSVGQAGFDGLGADTGEKLQEELSAQSFTPAAASCPDTAKVGTVSIKTPLLEKELTGAVYLAEQDTNPFASPLVAYIIAEEEVSKVLVKLAGEVQITPSGNLISEFRNTPQTPFETLTLHLKNGPRASQSTPAHCGEYHATASFTTWSGEAATEAKSNPEEFDITSGPGGSPCPGATLPFTPGFQAGVSNTQAAAFTPFTLTIERPDGSQGLAGIDVETPPGLAAILANVPLCGEPAAAEGTCGPESEIGQSTAESGLGGDPFSLPGKVYLTGPYDGAPFGLSAVTPLRNVGPFTLGTVVVRSSININPTTAQAIIDTNAATFFPEEELRPGGEHKGEFVRVGSPESFPGLPQFIRGTPAQIKALNVTVDRKEFEFNPTNCSELETTGSLIGGEGADDGVSAPLYPSNCASLPFTPKLTASVVGQGSKLEGTSFAVTIESPGLGQANIHKVDLTIPAVLPSRLSTIQKACPDAVFNANPASCDEGSLIGEGIVHTPVFKNPLRGPAYLVSHGSAEFPDVEFVLQGEGVTIVIDAKTDIKHGITYSKLETAPDAPFTKFEAIFPAGPHSALTPSVPEDENYNLCKTSLSVPTELTAQNGAFISETTNVEVTGCHGQKGFKVVLTRAQLLARELKTCRTKYKAKSKKSKRLACERKARKKYGPKHHAKKSTKGKKKT